MQVRGQSGVKTLSSEYMEIFQRPPGKLVAEAGAGIVWFQGSSSGCGTTSRGYEELGRGNQNQTQSRAP